MFDWFKRLFSSGSAQHADAASARSGALETSSWREDFKPAMLHEKTITAADLERRFQEVLDEIHRDGVVYIVKTNHRDTKLVPSGLVDRTGEVSFVLGPMHICGRVLGLVDEEYGWPKTVEVQSIKTVWDLSPRWRCHPFLHRGPVCLAVSIMIREYEQIKARLEGPPQKAGSEEGQQSC